MRLIIALLLTARLGLVHAGESTEYELVDALGGKAQLTELHDRVIANLVMADPALGEYRATIQLWAQQYLSWDAMREEMAALYRKYFTAEELSDMLAFYGSGTGRKVVLLTPTLLSEGSEIGARLTRAHKDELIEMLRQTRDGQALP